MDPAPADVEEVAAVKREPLDPYVWEDEAPEELPSAREEPETPRGELAPASVEGVEPTAPPNLLAAKEITVDRFDVAPALNVRFSGARLGGPPVGF